VDEHAREGRTAGPRPRAGRGRERLSPRRGMRINPSFGPEEHAELVAAARRAGLTPTGFCALAALAAARQEAGAVAADRAEFEALAGLQAELFDARVAVVRTGTNLNQAVVALNTTGAVPVWLEHVVDRSLRTLAALDEVISTVHRRLR
jgi:hypothetical protein